MMEASNDDNDDDDYNKCRDDDDDEDDYNEKRMNNNTSQQQEEQEPFCSVLNTIVDHVMVPPNPYYESEDYEKMIMSGGGGTASAGPEQNDNKNNNNNNALLLVPVVRVFGPILRRRRRQRQQGNHQRQHDAMHHQHQHDAMHQQQIPPPAQSACLHIHGVYPYFLARPIVAGPDGSLNRGTCALFSSKNNKHIDWDNADAVQRILPMLHQHLERAVQDIGNNGFDKKKEQPDKSKNNQPQPSRPRAATTTVKIIRQLTVVMGRGFYTYCPGPPAPFIRIEYYNPNNRWKVKKCLERGLSDIPFIYHPNPLQYQPIILLSSERRNGHNKAPTTDDADEDMQEQDKQEEANLRFHCYEAHIPYTMQFFKDYNLSGASYIHVHESSILFRRKLPSTLRRQFVVVRSSSKTGAVQQQQQQQQQGDEKDALLFLESNTPEHIVWPVPIDNENLETVSDSRDEQDKTVLTDFPPRDSFENSSINKRRYSLDPIPHQEEDDDSVMSDAQKNHGDDNEQLDSSSQWILDENENDDDNNVDNGNVDGKMLAKTMLDDKKNDLVRLRLVVPPPVKETTCDVELDVSVHGILNVQDVMKDFADNDDWEERQQIHWRAVPSLREIWQQERRRMSKLLKPAHDFLSHPFTDDKNEQPAFTLNVKKGAAVPGAELALQGMRRLFPPGLEDTYRRVLKDIVDRYADDIDRVDALLVNPSKHHDYSNDNDDAYATLPHGSSSSRQQEQQLTPSENETMEALCALGGAFTSTSSPVAGELEIKNSQADATTRSRSSSKKRDTEDNDLGLSQSSSTNTASEKSLDGNCAANDRFQSLSQVYYSAPPRNNGNSTQSEVDEDFEFSQRIDRGEPVIDGPFQYAEDVIDPQTLLPYEFIDDDEYDDDDDDDEQVVEKELQHLATQTLGEEEEEEVSVAAASAMGDDYVESHAATTTTSDSRRNAINLMLQGDSSVASGAGSASNDDDEVMSHEENKEGEGNPSLACGMAEAIQATLADHTVQSSDAEHSGKHPLSDNKKFEIEADVIINPPTRAEIKMLTTQLHPLPSSAEVLPTWMKHSYAYDRMRKSWANETTDPECWLPEVGERGITVQLTRAAPSRVDVMSWLSRRSKKRAIPISDALTSTKRAKPERRSNTAATLEIDANSGKIIGAGTFGIAGDHSGTAFEEIEEVEWQASQGQSQMELEGVEFSPETNLRETTESQQSCTHSNLLSGGVSMSKSTPESTQLIHEIASPDRPLQGIGNQGGRILVEGGGELKTKVRPSQPGEREQTLPGKQTSQTEYLPTPVSIMSIEIHVQCRKGIAGRNDKTDIAKTPDSERDKVYAAVYVYGKDPGGGDPIQVLERGCIFVPTIKEHSDLGTGEEKKGSLARLAAQLRRSVPGHTMGKSSPLYVNCVEDEKCLLTRLASVVYQKDPDMLLSWDTQGAGIGYLIERGVAVGNCDGSQGESDKPREIDMVRLFGRTRRISESNESEMQSAFQPTGANGTTSGDGIKEGPRKWKGSGMGTDWDERVGAGAAASSIPGRLVFAAWKIIAEEVKHPNASYQQAVAWSVLNLRIPFHDNLTLIRWYAENSGRERWRVIHYRLIQATASLLLFDALDIIGRSQEAAKLSGVEFSKSFPGIRGSQYKVEGVLLRALQSLNSNERGSKKGVPNKRALTGSTPESSLSLDSKSQTQSPWKVRRRQASYHGDQKDNEMTNLDLSSNRAYFFYSPSLEDTQRQEALEVQALNLEPKSGHYKDPVVVCDFTALYPSLVIAYNLCYSSIFGVCEYQSSRAEMGSEGKTTGRVGPMLYPEGRTATVLKHHMKSLSSDSHPKDKDRVYISPSRTLYVSETVCKGVLPQVLDEMLSTRAMLKKAAKQYKKNVPDLSPAVLRQLEARQLALKYVANVTYGYTSASFSGRCAMPLLADTIVECGRRTLSNAIDLANGWGKDRTNKWYGCEVIYGDTDSCFVKLPGRSVKEAFQFGSEFCRAVTASNPPPVQLKLEKVYSGSIMQTKKKYCGMKFESEDQRKPTFEAKGLETVRRDQCALTQKILRNCLISLFNSGIEAVKTYLFRQWQRILSRKVPISDFIITGRVRSRYRGGKVGPVQAALHARLKEADPGRVMRHGERLAYVIVATPGVRNAKLRDGVRTPMELLEQWDAFVVNSAYYITKHVNPALQRCFGLAPNNINVTTWYESCPKPLKRSHFWPITPRGSNATVSSFFGSSICALCGQKGKTQDGSRIAICDDCKKDHAQSLITSMERLNLTQRQAHAFAQQCAMCNLCFEDASTFAAIRPVTTNSIKANKKGSKGGGVWGAGESCGVVTPLANCSCIDCPITFERHRLREIDLEVTAVCRALEG